MKFTERYSETSENRGIIPGIDFYIKAVKKELITIKKSITQLKTEYQFKKFKLEENRNKAFMSAISEKIAKFPLEFNFENPLPEFPIHKLIISFTDISDKARAVYHDEKTIFNENGEIQHVMIGLKLYIDFKDLKNIINVEDLLYSRLPHELTHLYQHWKWNKKETYSINRQILKKEFGKLAKKYEDIANDDNTDKEGRTKNETLGFLADFLTKAIYYFSEKEIAAKVTQTYYELIKEKATKDNFLEKLDDTTHWKAVDNTYSFNLDILYDMILHGDTVVLGYIKDKKKNKIKMKFNEEDLSSILIELEEFIDNTKRTDIDAKYNLEFYQKNPKIFYLKLFKYLGRQIVKYKKKILKLGVMLPLEYKKPKKVKVENPGILALKVSEETVGI